MKIKKFDVPFSQTPNDVSNDPRLSWAAKGVWTYIQSKPDEWDFATERMCKDSSNGRDATRSAIAELQKYGYLTKRKLPSGRVEYELNTPNPTPENPSLGEPAPEKATDGKTHSGKTSRISNKDIKQIKSIRNKETLSGKKFVAPTVDEVRAYCLERKNTVNPEQFVDHYTANGWVQSGNKKIKDWMAAVRTWERNGNRFGDRAGKVYKNAGAENVPANIHTVSV